MEIRTVQPLSHIDNRERHPIRLRGWLNEERLDMKANQHAAVSRRSFIAAATATAAASTIPGILHAAALGATAARKVSPFRLSVISDEISQDFDHACNVAANEFGLSWVEIREIGGKSPVDFTDQQITDAQATLKKYGLRVTDIGSPLFKVDFPGAPSKSSKRDEFGNNTTFAEQDAVLEKMIKLCKAFNTERIRCFDFWRLDNPAPFRAKIDQKLRDAADRCKKEGLLLVIENEPACNTATGAEAARLLKSIPNSNFGLNWDPANSGMTGVAQPYPVEWDMLPKSRIMHCHCKDFGPGPDGKTVWLPVGKGKMDWVGQFKALKAIGYKAGVSMETHWRGGLTPEEATRQSIAGMFQALHQAGCL
jgi:sugar phosphate isomerase/epimerase